MTLYIWKHAIQYDNEAEKVRRDDSELSLNMAASDRPIVPSTTIVASSEREFSLIKVVTPFSCYLFAVITKKMINGCRSSINQSINNP